MSRYIDADRAIESLFDYCNGKKTIGQCIDDTPTEEVKPIVDGQWLYTGDIFNEGKLVCSNCGHKIDMADKSNFCPNCGATMRKESEEKA